MGGCEGVSTPDDDDERQAPAGGDQRAGESSAEASRSSFNSAQRYRRTAWSELLHLKCRLETGSLIRHVLRVSDQNGDGLCSAGEQASRHSGDTQ